MDEIVKEPFRDGVIAPFAQPHTVAIAPAYVDAESHTFKAVNDLIVSVYGAAQLGCGILAAVAHGLDRMLIHVGRISRRIDLDVATAGRNQARYDFALESDDVGEKVLLRSVGGGGPPLVKALAIMIGIDERDLGRFGCHAADEQKLLQRQVSHQAQPIDNRSARFGNVLTLQRLRGSRSLL